MRAVKGDKIRILHMEGEPQYVGREGIVQSIDDVGQIHGTWGGCAIIPETDRYEVIEKIAYKYISEYTDATTIEQLKIHGALSVRTANVLMWRGNVKTIGDLKPLKAEEIMRFRNAGRNTINEVEEFIRVYNNSRTELKEQKRLISVDDLLAYCNKCADTVQGLADKVLENIGLGESEISALGACAYFLQEARLYRFDIPNIIKCFIKESENGT